MSRAEGPLPLAVRGKEMSPEEVSFEGYKKPLHGEATRAEEHRVQAWRDWGWAAKVSCADVGKGINPFWAPSCVWSPEGR